MNQGWQPMESSIPNKQGTLRTDGNVLWPYQLSGHLPNDDEYHICPRNSGTVANGIYGRHGHTHSETRRRNNTTTRRTTPHVCQLRSSKTTRTQPLPQTRKVYIRIATNRIP